MRNRILGAGLMTMVCLGTTASRADDASKTDNIPPPGFRALFNGKDLTGWQGLVPINARAKMTAEKLASAQKKADERIQGHWTVKDGMIAYDGKADNLQTIKDFGDFELLLDWKIGPKGDSGIYLRGTPQVQIWDNKEGSGGLFNNQKNPSKPLVFADKPVGEWNTFHIIMMGDRVTVKLNGKVVVDNTPLENYWDRKSPLPTMGPIELQHHGDPLWFKNIYVKEPYAPLDGPLVGASVRDGWLTCVPTTRRGIIPRPFALLAGFRAADWRCRRAAFGVRATE